jgi:hypothetical protein
MLLNQLIASSIKAQICCRSQFISVVGAFLNQVGDYAGIVMTNFKFNVTENENSRDDHDHFWNQVVENNG